MRKPELVCAGCGVPYWPKQAWQHESCRVVANNTADDQLVANKVVANKAQTQHGRYSNKEKRRQYMKAYMAKKRAAGG